MILIGILFAAFHGKIGSVGTAAIDSSKEAVTLCITMLGVMSMWTGLMNIAKKAGIIDALTKGDASGSCFSFSRCTKGSQGK